MDVKTMKLARLEIVTSDMLFNVTIDKLIKITTDEDQLELINKLSSYWKKRFELNFQLIEIMSEIANYIEE